MTARPPLLSGFLPATLLLPLFLALAACGGEEALRRREVTVFAAASLREVVEDVARAFEAREGVPVALNFAGSNTLAQQIRAAPAADVFLSADAAWVDFLVAEGRVAPEDRSPFLGNTLVLVAHRDAPLDGLDLRWMEDLPRVLGLVDDAHTFRDTKLPPGTFRHLALADPEAVPAGRYAKALLLRAEVSDDDGGKTVWELVQERVVPTVDVRAALALVESDPRILGMVYRTDALASERARVVFEVSPDAGVEIAYHAALVRDGPETELGLRFLAFLNTPEALEIFRDRGFDPFLTGAG